MLQKYSPTPTSCLLSYTLTLTYTGVGAQLQGKWWAPGDQELEVEPGKSVQLPKRELDNSPTTTEKG